MKSQFIDDLNQLLQSAKDLYDSRDDIDMDDWDLFMSDVESVQSHLDGASK